MRHCPTCITSDIIFAERTKQRRERTVEEITVETISGKLLVSDEIYNKLLEKIMAGYWSAGERLPSEKQLLLQDVKPGMIYFHYPAGKKHRSDCIFSEDMNIIIPIYLIQGRRVPNGRPNIVWQWD